VTYLAEHGMMHLVEYMAQSGHPDARAYIDSNG
jgi:hypothetical protein